MRHLGPFLVAKYVVFRVFMCFFIVEMIKGVTHKKFGRLVDLLFISSNTSVYLYVSVDQSFGTVTDKQ